MNLYSQMLADLERREAELRTELERVRALQEAVKPLVAGEKKTARSAHTTQALSPNQTTGTAIPDLYTQIKVMSERRTLADLALQSLREAGRPLPLKQLLQAVRERGGGKDQTVGQLRASLVPTLRRRKEFTSQRRGFYGLREWTVDQAG